MYLIETYWADSSDRRNTSTEEVAMNKRKGSVSFQGKWCKFQTDAYQRLYQAAEIKSRNAATRWTWMTRRQASETLWLM